MEVKRIGARIIEEIENAEPKDIVTAVNRAVKTINSNVNAFEIKKLYEEVSVEETIEDGEEFLVDVSGNNYVDGTLTVYAKGLISGVTRETYTEIENYTFDSEAETVLGEIPVNHTETLTAPCAFEVDVSEEDYIGGTVRLYSKLSSGGDYVEITTFTFVRNAGIITTETVVSENTDVLVTGRSYTVPGDTDVLITGHGTSIVTSYDREHTYVVAGGLKKLSTVYVNNEKYLETNYATVKEYDTEQYYALTYFNTLVFAEDMETIIVDTDSNIQLEAFWEIAEIDSTDTLIDVPERFEHCLELGSIAEMYRQRRYYDEARYGLFRADFERAMEALKVGETNKIPISERNRRYTYQ